MLPIRTILHPNDFSENSMLAFPLACSLARDYDAKLVVVHVMQSLAVFAEGIVVPAPANYGDEVAERMEKELRPGDPRVEIERRMVEGDPATEILHLAKEIGCDLIVLGTHGRTGFSRLLLGSVAEQVVRRAPCPVLTVKNPMPHAEPAEQREAAHAL